MNPHLEQRLRRLEKELMIAQLRERHIKIRWIGKDEKRRPGLHFYPDPVAEDQPKLLDSDAHSTDISATVE